MEIEKLIFGILHLRLKWAFSVTSWGRTFQRNKLIGGVPTSDHLLWDAIDVVLDDEARNEQFEKDAAKCGIKTLWEGDHYHLTALP